MPEPVDLTFVTSDVFGGEWLQWGDSFTGLDDLVSQIKAKLKPGECIRRLVIAAHGAEKTDGFTVFDPDVAGTEYIDGGIKEPMSPETRAKLEKLKAFFCKEAVLELRICRFGTGKNGEKALQVVSDLLDVPVTAPTDSISSLALIGGLATNWKTAHPSQTGRPIEETFTRGAPQTSLPAGSSDGIAPVTGATVPLPSVNTRPPGAPTPQPQPGPVEGVAPITGSTVTSLPATPTKTSRAPRSILLGGGVVVAIGLVALAWSAFGGGDEDLEVTPTPTAEAPVSIASTSTPASTEPPASPTSAVSPNQPPTVTLLRSSLAVPVTTYVVEATDPEGGELSYRWTMEGEPCGTPLAPWVQTGAAVAWSHDTEPPDSCGHVGTDHAVVVTVEVSDQDGASVTCIIEGSETRVFPNPECEPSSE